MDHILEYIISGGQSKAFLEVCVCVAGGMAAQDCILDAWMKDCSLAFDSVRWEYLLEVMQRLGFGHRWRDLISVSWASTTSRILLNGQPGKPACSLGRK